MPLAIDISSFQKKPPADWFAAVKSAGFKLAISQAWGGLPGHNRSGANPYCEYQLSSFRDQGLATAIYVVVPSDDTTKTESLIEAASPRRGTNSNTAAWSVPISRVRLR